MTFTPDPEKHIVVNGKAYNREDLTEDMVQAISMINFADQESASMNARLRIHQLGRDALVRALAESIAESDLTSLGDVPPPAEATES